MRFTPDQINQGILHSQQLVRDAAVERIDLRPARTQDQLWAGCRPGGHRPADRAVGHRLGPRHRWIYDRTDRYRRGKRSPRACQSDHLALAGIDDHCRAVAAPTQVSTRPTPLVVGPPEYSFPSGPVTIICLINWPNNQSSSFTSTSVLYVESSNQRPSSFFQVLCPRNIFSSCSSSSSSSSVRVST